MESLDQRVAVVTGAASGIGRATALALAAQGCRLVLVDVDDAGLAQTASTIPGADLQVVDVSSRDAMAALARHVVDRHGGVQILVNNAGLSVLKTFSGHTLDDWDRVLGVNLYGVLHGCHFFLPHLLAAPEAHIVNISSLFGLLGVPGQAAYCTSKYAVRGLSEVLWEELAATSVGVTVVHPGGVRTHIADNSTSDDLEQLQRLRRFFSRHGVPPELVADRIVDAIRHDRPRVLVTREAVLGDWIRRLAPVAGNRLATRAMARAMRLVLPPQLPPPTD